MKRLGVLLDSYISSDIAFNFIYEGNHLDRDVDLCGFFIDLSPICANPQFAIMEAAESMTFYGPVIATSVRTAKYLKTNTNHDDKFYYVWDLEWMNGSTDFEEYQTLLKDMKIIARNDYVAGWLESLWGRKPEYIMDNFDLTKFTSEYDTTVRYTHAKITDGEAHD